tara:strand:+ start:460 stop:1464 length:1005 start_codon:yes stop_codon:yes gene_type:complete
MKKLVFEKTEINNFNDETISLANGFDTIRNKRKYYLGLIASGFTKDKLIEMVAEVKPEDGEKLSDELIKRCQQHIREICSSLTPAERKSIADTAGKTPKALGIEKKQNHSSKGLMPALQKVYASSIILFYVIKFNLFNKLNDKEKELFNPFCSESNGKKVLINKFKTQKTLIDMLQTCYKHKMTLIERKTVLIEDKSIADVYAELFKNNSIEYVNESADLLKSVMRNYLAKKGTFYRDTFNKVIRLSKDAQKDEVRNKKLTQSGKEFITKHSKSDITYFKALAENLGIELKAKADKKHIVGKLNRDENVLELAKRLSDKENSIHEVINKLKGNE